MAADKKNDPRVWAEVQVEHPAELTEAVANFLFEKGAHAIVHEESGAKVLSRAGFGTPAPPPGLKHELKTFLDELAGIFGLSSPAAAVWRIVPHGDWAQKWKQGLAPIEIGSRLVIKPTWCEYERDLDQVVLNLDPGLAFGTGHHASTLLCLEALEAYFSEPRHANARVLDIGTGSGILALASAALGQGPVIALDNDAAVLPVAAANLALNGLADRVSLLCADPAAVKGQFDLIMANLLRDELIHLALTLVGLGAPRARWILSGILEPQAEEVVQGFLSQGLSLTQQSVKGEWATLAMTRTEAS